MFRLVIQRAVILVFVYLLLSTLKIYFPICITLHEITLSSDIASENSAVWASHKQNHYHFPLPSGPEVIFSLIINHIPSPTITLGPTGHDRLIYVGGYRMILNLTYEFTYHI